MNSNPYISIVLVGRNDNYGVNFLDRFNTCIKSLDYQTAPYSNIFELVIVEWNPLPGHAPLKDAVYKPKNILLRIITVPNNIHNMLHAEYPVLEFYGKNAGIRRANGKFVLVTNPDIIFSNSIIEELALQNLEEDVLYRTDRYDFNSTGIENLHPREYVDFATKKTFVGHLTLNNSSWTTPINDATTMSELPTSSGDLTGIHSNGCGDFILASKELFSKANGLWETTHQKWHLDSYSLYRLRTFSKGQKVFTAPKCIFHMDHPRKPEDVSFSPEFAKNIIKNPKILISDTEEIWGLKNFNLLEFNTQY